LGPLSPPGGEATKPAPCLTGPQQRALGQLATAFGAGPSGPPRSAHAYGGPGRRACSTLLAQHRTDGTGVGPRAPGQHTPRGWLQWLTGRCRTAHYGWCSFKRHPQSVTLPAGPRAMDRFCGDTNLFSYSTWGTPLPPPACHLTATALTWPLWGFALMALGGWAKLWPSPARTSRFHPRVPLGLIFGGHPGT